MSKKGYEQSPWVFEGRALYQLHLVKASEAAKYIPEGLKLVQLFGYTLGGLFLARYDDSPTGKFNEMVVLAGLAWNPPTSCAWAARVLVDSVPARDHGLRAVGLPSRIAAFRAAPKTAVGTGQVPGLSWWGAHYSPRGFRPAATRARECPLWPASPEPPASSHFAKGLPVEEGDGGEVDVFNMEPGSRGHAGPLAHLSLPPARPWWQWAGPRVCLPLPSFSGLTDAVPHMLRYACDMHANVRLCKPISVSLPSRTSKDSEEGPESMAGVLKGVPILCIAFDEMRMSVQEPVRVPDPATQRAVKKAVALASLVKAC